MRTFIKIATLLVLAIGLVVPVLAQVPGPTPPGLYINWTIKLAPATPGGPSGTAQYVSKLDTQAKGYMHFAVECEYIEYPSGTMLDVFVKVPSPTPNQLTWIGRMEVQNDSAALLLTTARAPKITKGTQVLVKTDAGILIMAGRF